MMREGGREIGWPELLFRIYATFPIGFGIGWLMTSSVAVIQLPIALAAGAILWWLGCTWRMGTRDA